MTERFINERPIEVVVSRREKIDTPDGGWTFGEPVDLDPQTVRLTELTRAQSPKERTDENGSAVLPTHVAVAMPDRDFQRYDRFNAYGEKWLVVHVSRLPEWRLSLELVGRGSV